MKIDTPRTDKYFCTQRSDEAEDFARELERELAGFCRELDSENSVIAMVRLQAMHRELAEMTRQRDELRGIVMRKDDELRTRTAERDKLNDRLLKFVRASASHDPLRRTLRMQIEVADEILESCREDVVAHAMEKLVEAITNANK